MTKTKHKAGCFVGQTPKREQHCEIRSALSKNETQHHRFQKLHQWHLSPMCRKVEPLYVTSGLHSHKQLQALADLLTRESVTQCLHSIQFNSIFIVFHIGQKYVHKPLENVSLLFYVTL
jgi:hypothetical protein